MMMTINPAVSTGAKSQKGFKKTLIGESWDYRNTLCRRYLPHYTVNGTYYTYKTHLKCGAPDTRKTTILRF